MSSKLFPARTSSWLDICTPGHDAAMETNAQRRALQDSDTTGGIGNGQSPVSPEGLQWMIRARRNQALSTLTLQAIRTKTANVADALVAAQTCLPCRMMPVWKASKYWPKSTDTSATLAEITALRRTFEVSDGAKLSFAAKTDHRELGFRLTNFKRQQS
jgi:hypothetical protein